MYKENLLFHFGLPGSKSLTRDNSEQYSKNFYRQLGLSCFSGCWSEIDFSSAKINDFISKARELIKKDKAGFIGFSRLSQKLEEKAVNENSWYKINAANSVFEFCDKEKYGQLYLPTIKADKIFFNSNIAHGEFYNIYISEKFKTVVEKYALTGLDFLWMIDKGKYRANQWYIPVAKKPIGKGVDHPWFDPETLKGSDSWQPREKEFRTGVYHFSSRQIRKNIQFNNTREEILSLFKDAGLTIIGTLKYLSKYLPDTDFAFNWQQADDAGNGKTSRQRGLCINHRTRTILLNEGLITNEELEPIEIIQDVSGHQIVLDDENIYPPPLYTDTELAEIRKIVEKEFLKFKPIDKPEKEITLADTLRRFKEKKKFIPADFSKGIGISKIPAGLRELPDDYRGFLKISNGAQLNDECKLFSVEKIIEESLEKEKYQKNLNENFIENHAVIAEAVNGDWYVVDIRPKSIHYHKVLRISHEDTSPIYIWDNVIHFIHDQLTEALD